jgi:hypothetical protein
MNNNLKTLSRSSSSEQELRKNFNAVFKNAPLPSDELMTNLGLFIKRQNLKKVLLFNELYEKFLHNHGVIFEFGVRWGQNLALLTSLRGIHEPFNHSRKIVGFDTFSGFPTIHEKDGANQIVAPGAFAVTENYKEYLNTVLQYHENESPLNHIRKFELIEGDATQTIHSYLASHPETLIAFAYFDFDIYEPTLECLRAILPYVTQGTVLGFDELCHPAYPGETVALREVFAGRSYRVQRSKFCSSQSFIILD